MKKAVLFHGTDNTPDEMWYPWVIGQLEDAGYTVFAPLLPKNHTPNREVYEEFLKHSDWSFEDNILVGHSSGATTILNLLSADWFPRVRAAVLVGTFLNEKLVKNATWYEPGQFDNLFLKSYDSEVLKGKTEKFIFVHGDDDPHCDFEDAEKLCNQVGGRMVVIQGGGHLAKSSGIKELPQIIDELKSIL